MNNELVSYFSASGLTAGIAKRAMSASLTQVGSGNWELKMKAHEGIGEPIHTV